MKIPKPTEADKELFRSLVSGGTGVEVKPMFGNLGAFVNGNMFAGLFGSSVGVKLAEADRDELAAIEGSGPFGPEERPMAGYLSVPPSFSAERAAAWVSKAHAYVATLPPKVKKAKS
jgi:TfoX/Sxy family transcriptional regulator of competence genes